MLCQHREGAAREDRTYCDILLQKYGVEGLATEGLLGLVRREDCELGDGVRIVQNAMAPLQERTHDGEAVRILRLGFLNVDIAEVRGGDDGPAEGRGLDGSGWSKCPRSVETTTTFAAATASKAGSETGAEE